MTLPASELYQRAVEHANAGRNAAARRDLAAARARTDEPDLLARIAGTEAALRMRSGQADEAARLCREALAMPGIAAATRAVLEGQLGLVALEDGRPHDALALLDRAIAQTADDPPTRATMLLNRSVALMQARRFADARADLEQAVADFGAAEKEVSAAMALHNAGYVALLEGDLVPALEHMTQARATLVKASVVNAAISDIDRAEVLRDAGVIREAEDLLAKAAATFGVNRMPRARAEAEFSLARSLLTHDARRARQIARTAVRRFTALGNDTWAARADGVRLRAEFVADSGPAGAEAPRAGRVPADADVERTAAALDRIGLHSESAAVRMTRELHGIRHDRPRAARTARLAANASMEARLMACELRAVRSAARGRRHDAMRHAAEGLDLLGGWQSAFGSLDLQTSLAMHGNGLMLTGLAAAVGTKKPEHVFEWSERARHLSLQVVPLRPPPDPVLAGELAELRKLRADDPSWLDSPRASELRDKVRERQWSATGSATFEQRTTLEEVRGRLDDDTAFVSYVYTDDGMSALVATVSGEQLVPLPLWPQVRRAFPGLRADLDMAASQRAGPLADIVRRSLDARLAALSRALVDQPLAAAGGASRLVLTAPGALSGIPWSMLPGLRGRVFSLAPSATRWVRLRSRPLPAPRSATFVAGPRVARGDEEVELAASRWTSPVVLKGDAATVAAVTAQAQHADVLHVAAHGRHSGDNPLFSGLELDDGTLFGYDIDLIQDVPPTVVLSACEVGRSSVRWREEAIGMTRVWLHAGARCVIASPVVVADDDACELLGAVHAGLARGEAPAEALATASARTGVVAPFQVYGTGF